MLCDYTFFLGSSAQDHLVSGLTPSPQGLFVHFISLLQFYIHLEKADSFNKQQNVHNPVVVRREIKIQVVSCKWLLTSLLPILWLCRKQIHFEGSKMHVTVEVKCYV